MRDCQLDFWRGPSMVDAGVARLLNEGAQFDEVSTPLRGAPDVTLAPRQA